MFSVIIITVHFQVALIEEQFTVFHHLSIWLSTFVWWMFLLAFDVLPLNISLDLYHLFLGVVAWNPQYWLYLPLVPLACVSPDWFFRAVRRQLYPPDHLLVIEKQYLDEQALKKNGPRGGAPARLGVKTNGVNPASSSFPQPGSRSKLPPSPGIIGSKSASGGGAAVAAAGGGGGRGEEGATTAQKQAVVKSVFDQQLEANKGYVPPYDPQSQFYNILSNGQMADSMHRQSAAARGPVLQVLDAQFAANVGKAPQAYPPNMNPYRMSQGQGQGQSPAPSMAAIPSFIGSPPGNTATATTAAILSSDPRQIIAANPHLSEPESQILATYARALEP